MGMICSEQDLERFSNKNKQENKYPNSCALSLSSFPMAQNSTPRKEAQRKGYLFTCFCIRADSRNHTLRVLTNESETLGELHPQFEGPS